MSPMCAYLANAREPELTLNNLCTVVCMGMQLSTYSILYANSGRTATSTYKLYNEAPNIWKSGILIGRKMDKHVRLYLNGLTNTMQNMNYINRRELCASQSFRHGRFWSRTHSVEMVSATACWSGLKSQNLCPCQMIRDLHSSVEISGT